MELELKKCPFCGNNAELLQRTVKIIDLPEIEPKYRYVAKCKKCNATMECASVNKAIQSWNRRV